MPREEIHPEGIDLKYCYQRGEGPLVSVLIPTRGRPEKLARAIDSLWSLAVCKEDVEFMLKVDDDDNDTLEVVKRIGRVPNIIVNCVISPRGRGYKDLAAYYNLLASRARGDWLFIFNDDARMLTPCWDRYLRYQSRTNPAATMGVQAVAVDITNRPQSNEFMFVRKHTFDLLGHLGEDPAIDTWMFNVLAMVNAFVRDPYIKVEHINNDKDAEEDLTTKERRRDCNELESLITSPGTIMAKMTDAMKLMTYMENYLLKRAVNKQVADKLGTEVEPELGV